MKVIIREAAYDDLDRIFTWIAKDRPRSAHSVINRILESADRLGRFPHLGHVG
jgi:plasmid stabilization system protein ParE